MSSRQLTESQEAALTEAESYLAEASDRAKARLSEAGFDFDDDDTSCLRCGCEGYSSPDKPPFMFCETPGCGHRQTLHKGFI